MVVMGVVLIAAVLAVGNIFLRLHTLPERMAHKKLQFEIVAVLGLLALFTHIHLFWVAGLVLALIDLPDFGTPLRSIADSARKIADSSTPPAPEPVYLPPSAQAEEIPAAAAEHKEQVHA